MPYRSAMRRAALIVASSSAILALAASATAEARFETGLGGGNYVSGTAAYRAQWLDHAVEARAEIVRLTVGWSSLVSTPPANPGDPADPAYHFQLLDAAISDARNR